MSGRLESDTVVQLRNQVVEVGNKYGQTVVIKRRFYRNVGPLDLSLNFSRSSDVSLEFLGESFRFRTKIGEVILR